jgi:predicted nucleic acid-binding protein
VWIEAGILLRRARSAFGGIDFVHHFRDLLIALEAVREEATLVTENVRDFARWRSLLASAQKTLRIFDPSQPR